MKSLMDAIRYFGDMTDIDASRIAIEGYSYGGFFTLAALAMDQVFELIKGKKLKHEGVRGGGLL